MGAATALLNTAERERIILAVKQIEKMETALEPKFQEYFVEAMKFPTATATSGDAKTGRRSARSAGRAAKRRAAASES